jgi:Fis family transcriptional regulator
MTIPNTRESAAEAEHPIPLRENVKEAIRRYLEDMGNSQPDSLYRTLLAEVEPPLIEEVLRYTQGNQSRTAKILGMTRNTLRSKLNRYRIVVDQGKP